ncbi:hypothetical protein M9H77_29794 [Catharanthus roseus]|uniref:Uncharacterized protein n=1 Tax=Catharanthus roseus TaxID=4058 RepID=A0ACB9ZY08_CATRO|nr:hypothetical protein M9H77_29794 [Catharanthus roseus]
MGTTSSKLEEYSGNSKLVGIGTSTNGSKRDSDNHFQMEKEKSEVVMSNGGTITRVPKAEEGEQIAAGWPSWLASVAGEAINGWIGQGIYSNVYKARDTINSRIVALKKVRFDLEPESVRFMAREILICRRLDHPNIIKLECLIVSRQFLSLYLIF